MNRERRYFSRFVRVGLYKTHYIEWGDGEPVVMVHGGGPGASGEFGWGRTIGAIGEYGRGIALDLLGFGLSDKPEIEYSHQVFVEHLAGFLDVLCLEKVNLMGNSMGAYVVAKYAVDHPDRVKKLLLVSSGTIATAMGVEMGMSPGFRQLLEYDGTREGLRRFLEGILRHPERITEEEFEERYRRAQLPGVMQAQKSFLDYMQRRRKQPSQAQLFDLRHRLPQLEIPILFVWGKYDIFASVDLAERLQQLLPNTRFVIFEDSGHVVQNDEPERFNELAVRFFFRE
jgi:pimeloyl-ACP methyl ester carboxylesterase